MNKKQNGATAPKRYESPALAILTDIMMNSTNNYCL